MSIFKKILNRKHENQSAELPVEQGIIDKPADKSVVDQAYAIEDCMTTTVETKSIVLDDDKPDNEQTIVPVIEGPYACSNDQHAIKEPCSCNDDQHKCDHHEEQKVVENIPLGSEEINSLIRNKYDDIKHRFTKTFVIEKTFWAYYRNAGVNSRQAVRVKRVAELKAASLMHALKMIGWDNRNVSLLDVKDDYKGEIDVKIDGVFVDKIPVPSVDINTKTGEPVSFEQMSGSQRKLFDVKVSDVALKSNKVEEWLKAKKRHVVKCSVIPYSHVNLTTKRLPKVKKETVGKVTPAVTTEVKE